MESIIKWKDGHPVIGCNCLVIVKNHKGKIFTSTDNWSAYCEEWNIHNYKKGYTVIGWYPISEITPLKENDYGEEEM